MASLSAIRPAAAAAATLRSDREPVALPRVRAAMAADLAAVAALHTERLQRGACGFAPEPMDLRAITAMREQLVTQGYPCLVAECEGEGVRGFAFAAPFASRAAWRGTVEANICVHPDATGRGLGRALLTALVAACEAKRFRQMIAVIGTDQEGEATAALHRALGFTHAGVLRGVGLRMGRVVDSLLMQRALDGTAARA